MTDKLQAIYEALVQRYGTEQATYLLAKRQERQENAQKQQQARQAAEAKERAEREQAHATLQQATRAGLVVARRRHLEAYVADITNAKDRATLITMLEATRAAFLDD
jgi:hypothetical protein